MVIISERQRLEMVKESERCNTFHIMFKLGLGKVSKYFL